MLFVVELILKMLSILFFVWLVRYRDMKTQHNAQGAQHVKTDQPSGGLFGILLRTPILLLFSVSCMLFSVVLSQNTYSLPLHLESIFGDSGTTYYGIVMGVYAFIVVAFTGAINKVTRKRKKLDLILLACALVGIGFGMIYLGNYFWMFILSTTIWSLADILNTPNASAYFSEFAPPSMLGRFAAWIKIVTGAGYAIGPIFMGIVIDLKGTAVVWPILLIIAVFSACILNIVRLMDKKRIAKLSKEEGNGSD
jgi:MFS family permease